MGYWVKAYLNLPLVFVGHGVIWGLLQGIDKGDDRKTVYTYFLAGTTAQAAHTSSVQFYWPCDGWRFITGLVNFV